MEPLLPQKALQPYTIKPVSSGAFGVYAMSLILLTILLGGCHSPTQNIERTEPVVLYSGRGESLVGELIEQAQAATGITIEVQYGDTAEMVTRLLAEGAESPADLILAQDPGHLGALAARNLLAPLPSNILEIVSSRFRDPAGNWVGTSGRLRVLVYDTQALSPETLPTRLAELADPKWKGKLGWAPTNSSFQAHVSALRATWGEPETRRWLEGMSTNEPLRYPKNSPQVQAVHDGAIEIGWVNHYYLHRKLTPEFQAANWSFPEEEDAGNVMMLAGAGIRNGSPRAEAAQTVIAWLLSEEAQKAQAIEGYEYPTRPGVPTHPDVPPLSDISLSDVSQDALMDLGHTRTLLRDLGLL